MPLQRAGGRRLEWKEPEDLPVEHTIHAFGKKGRRLQMLRRCFHLCPVSRVYI